MDELDEREDFRSYSAQMPSPNAYEDDHEGELGDSDDDLELVFVSEGIWKDPTTGKLYALKDDEY